MVLRAPHTYFDTSPERNNLRNLAMKLEKLLTLMGVIPKIFQQGF